MCVHAVYICVHACTCVGVCMNVFSHIVCPSVCTHSHTHICTHACVRMYAHVRHTQVGCYTDYKSAFDTARAHGLRTSIHFAEVCVCMCVCSLYVVCIFVWVCAYACVHTYTCHIRHTIQKRAGRYLQTVRTVWGMQFFL